MVAFWTMSAWTATLAWGTTSARCPTVSWQANCSGTAAKVAPTDGSRTCPTGRRMGENRIVTGPVVLRTPFETPECIRGTVMPAFFEPRLRWDYNEGLWAIAADTAYSIEVSEDGLPVARIEMDVEPRGVSLEMVRREQGDVMRWGPNRDCIISIDEAIEARGHPDYLQPIADLRISAAGEIWVLRGRVNDEPAIIDIWSKTGEHLGTLPPGSPFPTEFVGPERILVARTDEFGATLTMMRVSRR